MANKSKRKNKDKKMNDKLNEKFKNTFNETETIGNEVIYQRNVADATEEYMCIFGSNKNLFRAIPSLVDGMKPGKRRLFYSWWIDSGRPMNTNKDTLKKINFNKVDRVAARTMDFHPHGKDGTTSTLASEGQYWNNNVMTIVPKGSYGNMKGHGPAAGRYIEAKISEYTIDCFFDKFDQYPINMTETYDGKNLEPAVLPAKYPHILFNPQFSGMGYGLASNIPGFNVTEVLEATIKLIKNPSAKIMLIPESPTGCDVVDTGNFKEINNMGLINAEDVSSDEGVSKVKFVATSEIDYVNNEIHITSLPMYSSSDEVMKKIYEFMKKGNFKEINDMLDNTKSGEVDIVIKLDKGAKPEKILKELYKKDTGLTDTRPICLMVIDDFQAYQYGVKGLLLAWIDNRIETVRSMMLNFLQNTLNKEHMNDVLLRVFDKSNIEKTVNISKTSKSRKDMVERLMKEFAITSVQAGTIADMRIYNFNEDSYLRYKEEAKNIKDTLKNITEILEDEDKIKEYIIKELEEGKKKWGRDRVSHIIRMNDKSKAPDTEHLLGISETGYIKKISAESNISIGSIGKTNSMPYVFKINNQESLLVIDSSGNVSKVSVSAIPDMEFDDIGVELSKFFSVNGEIKAAMELPSMKILDVDDDSFGIIIITRNGLAKRTKLNEYRKIVDTKPCITLNKNDKVASANFSIDNSSKDIIISTNKGRGIRLSLSEIRNTSCTSKGTSMISLDDDEYVVNSSIISNKKKLLFYATSAGRCKVTESKLFPTMNRKDSPLSLIKLISDEELVSVKSVNPKDVVRVYLKKGSSVDINIADLQYTTRLASGEKIIKTPSGDKVVGFKILEK